MMRPILFNTDMVRAILEGRKTVTRRIVNGYELEHLEVDTDGSAIGVYDQYEGYVRSVHDFAPCKPDDILYVRETWRVQSAHRFEADAKIEFRAGGPMVTMQFDGKCSDSHEREDYDSFISKWGVGERWHPSLHMPKDAARIFLRVKSVTVERLQDMVLGDVLNEGVQEADTYEETWDRWHKLWDSTVPKHPNKFKSYPFYWKDNPWVWVIKFEWISKEQAMEATQNAGV